MSLSIIFNASSTFAGGIVHWFWSKPVYSQNGLMTLSNEIVKYDVRVDADDFLSEVNRLNTIIGTVALNGRFSNIEQFQERIREQIVNDRVLSNFTIVDVYVDER